MKAANYFHYMVIKPSIKIWVLYFAMGIVLAVSGESASFFGMVIAMISIFLPFTLVESGTTKGWEQLYLSFPISRQEVVKSKYLVFLVANLCVLALSLCSMSVFVWLKKSDWTEAFLSIACVEAIVLCIDGALIAVAIKWGIEKARYIMLTISLIPMLLPLLLKRANALPDFSQVTTETAGMMISIAMVAAVIFFLLCYLCSVRIYIKREF